MLSTTQRRALYSEEYLRNETFRRENNITEEFLDEYMRMDHVYTYLKKIKSLRGKFTEGNLEGKIVIDYYDGTTFEGLAKDGVFHGICRALYSNEESIFVKV